MSADQPLYDDSIEGVAAFYDDCNELNIPPVQYVAELPALYVSANGCECQRCNGDDGDDGDDGTRARARFVIEHESLEIRVHAECCADHTADLVREIGGRPSGTRIEDWQQRETKQSTLDATSGGEREQEGEA